LIALAKIAWAKQRNNPKNYLIIFHPPRLLVDLEGCGRRGGNFGCATLPAGGCKGKMTLSSYFSFMTAIRKANMIKL
jgi:hypothetical protein